MPDVKPFNALRYTKTGDVSKLIAPPYDVLSESDKRQMLARDPNNIVGVDLPHTPPKSAGPAEAYREAADRLSDLIAKDVLVRDSAPAVYAYQQTFESGGRRFVRRGFIARVRAEQFRASPAGIFPHEQTFSGPKEDRLMLMRAARCQLSPIFGLFADEGNAITDSLYANLPPTPLMAGMLGDVRHEVWRVDAPDKMAALTAAMASRPIFIADGHHRYTTSLNYLAELEGQGTLPADHPARFVMFVCVSMHDPGLAILPTHRVVTVRQFDQAKLVAKLDGPFKLHAGRLSVEGLESAVLARGPGWFGVKLAGRDDSLLLELAERNLLDRYEPQRGEAYRRLDVAILHRFLIQEALTPLAGEPVGIEYPHNGHDAAAALAKSGVDAATAFGSAGGASSSPTFGRGAEQETTGEATKVALIMAPTPLAAVRDVCLSGELMPQKSTFFYPKLATGLTLYGLAE